MRKTAFNGADMLATAQGVMAARGAIMAAAATSPLKADYAELGRMVPEKVAAFTSASCAITTILWETGAAWMRYGQQLGGMAMRWHSPTDDEGLRLAARWTGLMLTSVEASARLGTSVLAPYRSQVKANAHRLQVRKSPPR